MAAAPPLQMPTSFLLFESASGYGLFEVTGIDELSVDALQTTATDMQRFGKAVKLAAFKPYTSAAQALTEINAVSESQARRAARGRAVGPATPARAGTGRGGAGAQALGAPQPPARTGALAHAQARPQPG